MIKGIHHTALSTPDLENLLEFYCDILGAEQIGPIKSWDVGNTVADDMLAVRNTASKFAMIKFGAAYLELFEFTAPNPVKPDRRAIDYGIAHLCIEVDDCRAEYARLIKAGMRFNSAPEEFEDGSVFTYGLDTDGNIIELLEIPEGVIETPSNYVSSETKE